MNPIMAILFMIIATAITVGATMYLGYFNGWIATVETIGILVVIINIFIIIIASAWRR